MDRKLAEKLDLIDITATALIQYTRRIDISKIEKQSIIHYAQDVKDIIQDIKNANHN